jgi:dihydroxyacid dehydratase/phosphogluconate dehydratase
VAEEGKRLRSMRSYGPKSTGLRAQECGRLIVATVRPDQCLSRILTCASLENVVRNLAAIGVSATIAIVFHLLAIAGRLRVLLTPKDFKHQQHVLRAEPGCDFDLRASASRSLVERESH